MMRAGQPRIPAAARHKAPCGIFPTGKETMQGTLMVIAMAVIASLFFLLLDQILKFFLELVLKVSF